MFESSAPFLFCEYFRVPTVAGEGSGPWARLAAPARAGALYWPGAGVAERAAPAACRLGEIPLVARLVPDAEVEEWLRGREEPWSRGEEIRDGEGARAGSVWRDGRGSVLLPFDPSEAILGYWSEGYQRAGGR